LNAKLDTLTRRVNENGDAAEVKHLKQQIKKLQAEATLSRARERKATEKNHVLEDALEKQRYQKSRTRASGLAESSCNVRASAPAVPVGKREVDAEFVHLERRTDTAKVRARNTRGRKSSFFLTKE
jgi:hypothetical protein